MSDEHVLALVQTVLHYVSKGQENPWQFHEKPDQECETNRGERQPEEGSRISAWPVLFAWRL